MKTAYEVKVSFVGKPTYIYTYSWQEAMDIKYMVESQPAENAAWGIVKASAIINPLSLGENEYIECGNIVTKIYPSAGRKRSA